MTTGAELYQLHLAGKRDLDEGASGVYDQMKEAASSVSVPSAGVQVNFRDAWDGALEQLQVILLAARGHMKHGGDVLRMIAYAYAENDEAAKNELLDKADWDEIPEHDYTGPSTGGWYDSEWE